MEFAIWGKPPGHDQETLLYAMPQGKPVTSRAEAERVKAILESGHGCTDCRIQELDGEAPDFIKTINS